MILTLLPTKARPEQCYRMLESYRLNTVGHTCVAMMLNSGDDIGAYERCFKLVDCYSIHPKNTTVTEMINQSIHVHNKRIKYYHLTNDDVLYQTKGWDEYLSQAIPSCGIAYGNDLFQGEKLCTFPFISAEIVRALGWIHMPKLNRYYADTIWHFIGTNANCLYYEPNVIIEHLHCLAGKAIGSIDNDVYQEDSKEFARWLPWSFRDIEKVKKIIGGSNERY